MFSEAAWSSKLSFLSKGKTTLLKHIANRALSIPPNIDVLLCEQGEAAGGRGAGGGKLRDLRGATTGVCEPAKNRRACGCELEGFCGETGDWEMGATEVGGVR